MVLSGAFENGTECDGFSRAVCTIEAAGASTVVNLCVGKNIQVAFIMTDSAAVAGIGFEFQEKYSDIVKQAEDRAKGAQQPAPGTIDEKYSDKKQNKDS